jgi:TPR repeat protein
MRWVPIRWGVTTADSLVLSPSIWIKPLQYKLVAATAGYSLAEHDVGIIYFQRNQFAEAVRWWQRSAEQGYPSALYNLSVI